HRFPGTSNPQQGEKGNSMSPGKRPGPRQAIEAVNNQVRQQDQGRQKAECPQRIHHRRQIRLGQIPTEQAQTDRKGCDFPAALHEARPRAGRIRHCRARAVIQNTWLPMAAIQRNQSSCPRSANASTTTEKSRFVAESISRCKTLFSTVRRRIPRTTTANEINAPAIALTPSHVNPGESPPRTT